MKTRLFYIYLSLAACMTSGCKDDTEIVFEDHMLVDSGDMVHANERDKPYPREEHDLYINPSPLIVPNTVRGDGELLEFELSQDPEFPVESTFRSGKVDWNVYNIHQEMAAGEWYWRFRVVRADGKADVWSEVNKFTVEGDEPVFVTPPYAIFKENLANINFPRYYTFLEADITKAVKNGLDAQPAIEVKNMQARAELGLKYNLPSKAWDAAGGNLATQAIDYLYPAYRMTDTEEDKVKYRDKMLELAKKVLAAPGEVDGDPFWVNSFADAFGPIYDVCRDNLTDAEKKTLENLLAKAAIVAYNRMNGKLETHVFENHTWQKGLCGMVKCAIMVHDTHPEVLPVLEYAYEVWTARAPAGGFNFDGTWHNGAYYYQTNQSTLYYMPLLYTHLTGTDFMQHPWYKAAGKAYLYDQLGTEGLSFGDGSGLAGGVTARLSAAWADFLARETKDSYAVYYVKQCKDEVLYDDFSMRLYRMARHHVEYGAEPVNTADLEQFIWNKTTGEGKAHTNLAEPGENVAISFRSSPYGSGSHTMSDQNSFKLSYKGHSVFSNAGYYENFSDAHNLLQYRHTRGHNTIMINNIGQPFTTRAFGNISQALNGKNLAYFQGDASNAYCGVSEYSQWEKSFAEAGLAQIPAYGFGETPLNRYVRHIFLLRGENDKNMIVVYDDLGAGEPATWQWLLHSKEVFRIAGNKFTTTDMQNYTAVGHIYSNEAFSINATNEWFPGGEPVCYHDKKCDLKKQWHLTADFDKCAANKILTIIQVGDKDADMSGILRIDNKFLVGDWEIEAEMRSDSDAYITVKNKATGTVFNYGSDAPDGYQRQSEGSSVLLDEVNGEMKMQEVSDLPVQATRSGK